MLIHDFAAQNLESDKKRYFPLETVSKQLNASGLKTPEYLQFHLALWDCAVFKSRYISRVNGP